MVYIVHRVYTTIPHPAVKKFFETLSDEQRALVRRSTDVIAKFGARIGFPDMRRLGNNLYEFRITGKTHIRILYTVVGENAYLLHAFMKKSQKLRQKDIYTARIRLKSIV